MNEAFAKVKATYNAQDGGSDHADVTRYSDGTEKGRWNQYELVNCIQFWATILIGRKKTADLLGVLKSTEKSTMRNNEIVQNTM